MHVNFFPNSNQTIVSKIQLSLEDKEGDAFLYSYLQCKMM